MLPICDACKHILPYKEGVPRFPCAAFPEGIPAGVWNCTLDHTKPLPGDHGIQFEAGDPEEGSAMTDDQTDAERATRFCDTSLEFIKLLTREELEAIERAAQERIKAAKYK